MAVPNDCLNIGGSDGYFWLKISARGPFVYVTASVVGVMSDDETMPLDLRVERLLHHPPVPAAAAAPMSDAPAWAVALSTSLACAIRCRF